MANTNTAVTHTTATQLIGTHEVLRFNDGRVEIEDWKRNFEEENTALEHVSLNHEQAIALRDFLNATL